MSKENSLEFKTRFIKAIDTLVKMSGRDFKEVDLIRSLDIIPANFYRMRISDKHFPTVHNCIKICELYNISGDWLLNGKGSIINKPANNVYAIQSLKEAVMLVEQELDKIKSANKLVNKKEVGLKKSKIIKK